jgi:hypothetical protein
MANNFRIEEQKCPHCSGTLEHGFIAGHWFRLRWVKKAKKKNSICRKTSKKKDRFMECPTS